MDDGKKARKQAKQDKKLKRWEKREEYEVELRKLQEELCHLQDWVKEKKLRIIIIFEGGAHVWREIHMDGRPLPKREDLNPTYFGYSVGRWEGDTLVVETTGFNEKTWLNFNGTMHTDELTTVERISRPNRDTLHYEATINDPGAYTKPWTIAWDIPWNDGAELAEYICQENNKFLLELKDDNGKPFFEDEPTENP